MCDIITVGIVHFPVNLSRNATTATTTTALLMKRRRTSVVLTRTRTCADRNDECGQPTCYLNPKIRARPLKRDGRPKLYIFIII